MFQDLMTGELPLLFEVTDIGVTRFSPDGQFLSVGRMMSEDVMSSRKSSITSHFADQWYFDGCIWAFQPYVCLAIGRTRDGILQCWYWIWEVSMAISHIILETKPPVTSVIMSICPPHDGHRILVGDEDGIARMWVIGYCMIIPWKNGSHHIRAMCWILGCSYLGDCRALGYCIFAKRQPDVEVIALYGVIYLLSINISIMVQGRLVLADKERT